MTKTDEGGSGGRRRSARSHEAILRAAVELSDECGIGAVTIEGIAARAGCGKQTIYRWWPSKELLLVEALGERAVGFVKTPASGNLDDDLASLLRRVCKAFRTGSGEAVAGLIATAQFDPAVKTVFRDGMNRARRDVLQTMLSAAQESGQVAADIDVEVVIDAVYGALWSRLLLGHAPMDNVFADTLARQTLDGLRPRA